ncbi:MAG: molybdopterin-dependent oxidoreductase, partial [Clostridia bacterium]|nr:molybdopterin-dependent oxidoreductase [Clostridia bacterium]
HDNYTGTKTLALFLHSLHSGTTFASMGGSCESCHVVMPGTGEWALWDTVKYQILSGIISADASAGEFSFNQTTTIPRDDLFVMDWLYEANDYERYYAIQSGDIEGDPALFDSWEIVVTDLDGVSTTYLLTDLIANVPSKTALITMECIVNQPGAGLINNFEVTGLPIQDVLSYAGIGDEAKAVYVQNFVEGGLYPTAINLDWAEDHDILLGYEIDGQRLRVQDGFPVMLCSGGLHAGNFKKQVWTLTVSKDQAEMDHADTSATANGLVMNQGVFYTQEGQIIPLGEPYTFEGYAFGYGHEIASMEFSLDGGVTWASFATDGTSDQQWVYWYYTFTPQEPGAYVLYVRTISTDGLESIKPTTIMVNAK